MALFDGLKGSSGKNKAEKDAARSEKDKLKYMSMAYKEAERAFEEGDVPIGCIIVNEDGKVVGKAYNRRNRDGSTTSHAEILAIQQACKKCGDWRLEDCEMYVTLEPCPMCAGAILQARMKKVYIGATNSKAGCAGSVINLLQMDGFNHKVEVEKGLMGDQCSILIKEFFEELRQGGDI
ncbi:MAG: nucleoside deaminase [Lachnospiraceae bacterium]|nr:nucleoside deaminase [Lachnospiraceae bacterium]